MKVASTSVCGTSAYFKCNVRSLNKTQFIKLYYINVCNTIIKHLDLAKA